MRRFAQVSIKDIARSAGLSHSTISRALRDSSLVNPETRRRIQKLAKDMNYTPDAWARSLVLRRTQTIGVVVTSISDPLIAEVIQEIESAAYESDFSIILASSAAEPGRELAAVRMLRSKRVDGVIVTSSRIGALYREHLRQIGVPIVLINSHSEQEGRYSYSVTVDNFQGGFLAARHLIGLGHRRIAYIDGPEGHSSSTGRRGGYRKALEEAGVPFDPSLAIPGDERITGGAHAVPILMDRADPPTAIFCYNDLTAFGVLRAVASRGISVPRELSVVGFDDIELARSVSPSLTTIAQPKGDLGRRSMRMLLSLMRTENPEEDRISDIVLPGELIVRESTGSTASARRDG